MSISTAYLSQRQPSNQSVETSSGTVDDWFESEPSTSRPQQSSPWAPDDAITPPPTGSSTFRRSLFQPINDKNDDIVEHRPPIQPLIRTDDDQLKTKRSATPRMSESGFFTRSPEPKVRRPSSSPPVTKKHQTDTLTVINQPSAKTLSQTTPASMNSTSGQRMSGWNVRENSPNDSDEN